MSNLTALTNVLVVQTELGIKEQLKEFNLREVAEHDSIDDCWIVIYDRVYDITYFLDEHPGGREVLLEYAGRDATIAFRGTGHSVYAVNSLGEFLIGQLPPHERIYRKMNGYKLSNIPE